MKAAVTEFLNTYPLFWYLEQVDNKGDREPIELIKATPSECAMLLMGNKVEYGVVPVAAYAFNQDLSLLLSPCIASREKVRTVKLYSAKEIREITEVMIDEDSKTSVILLHILLKYKYKNYHANYVKYNYAHAEQLDIESSYMLIGDKNFTIKEKFAYEYDLAYEWVEWIRLPFIFATWMLKNGSGARRTANVIKRAYRMAKSNFEQMCLDASLKWNMPVDIVKNYFTTNLSYEIGMEGIKSIRLFFDMATELELIPKVERIKFADV